MPGRAQRELIREYVREVLTEDDTAGVWSDLHSHDMMMGHQGTRFGSGADLFRIFIKPFIDVFDTTMGKAQELSVRAQTLAKVAFETIATTLVPVFSDSYKEIFTNEKKKLDRIRQEYAEVYKSNWDAFRDNDAFWTAFCYAPWAIMTIKFIKHSPRNAAMLISALTGRSADRVLSRLLGDWRGGGSMVKTGLGYRGRETMGVGFGDYGGAGYGGFNVSVGESLVRERKKKGKGGDDRLAKAARVLAGDEFVGKLRQSDIVKGMESAAKDAVHSSLRSVYADAQAVMSSKSLEELQQRSGKHIKGIEKLSGLQGEERQKVERALLASLRQAMKNFYIKSLEAKVAAATGAGIPEDSPYVQAYASVIGKIRSL